MINILIVDDENYIRDELKYIIGKFEGYHIQADTGDADEVIDLIETHDIQVVFLDIELRHGNGISVARKINDLEHAPYIIFSTAYDKYAISGYELNVVDYILKPFSESRVLRALEKTKGLLNKKTSADLPATANKIAVVNQGRQYLMPVEEAIYFESLGNNAIVKTKETSYTLTSSLKKIEERLVGHNFKRISKSHIVNVDQVVEIIPWFNYKCKLRLKDVSEELVVTRNYYKEFKNAILFN